MWQLDLLNVAIPFVFFLRVRGRRGHACHAQAVDRRTEREARGQAQPPLRHAPPITHATVCSRSLSGGRRCLLACTCSS